MRRDRLSVLRLPKLTWSFLIEYSAESRSQRFVRQTELVLYESCLLKVPVPSGSGERIGFPARKRLRPSVCLNSLGEIWSKGIEALARFMGR
jgi:hypothetical protein